VGKSIIDLSSVTRVGLDLAKRVFRIHAVDATGSVVIARSVNRRTLLKFFDALPRCLVAMEACSSAHHWGRQLLELGFAVRLIPPAHVDGKTNDRPAMLASVCAQLGGDKGSLDEALTTARPDAHTGWTRRGLTPFDYRRRLRAVLADGPQGLTLIVKGAPEAVMEA
jgi:transposase